MAGIALPGQRPLFFVRLAEGKDTLGILDCLRAAFEEYRQSYTAEAFLDTVLTAETLQQRLENMVVFAAADADGRIWGTIACKVVKKGEGHLRGMAVLPHLRGAGIAERLLNRAEEELRSHNCIRVTLDTTEPLQRAMRFYEKHGYRRSGKVTDFFGMPLIEYEKTLS